jgi:hypothetical protein
VSWGNDLPQPQCTSCYISFRSLQLHFPHKETGQWKRDVAQILSEQTTIIQQEFGEQRGVIRQEFKDGVKTILDDLMKELETAREGKNSPVASAGIVKEKANT